jgi:hypothetical protein
MSTKKAGRKVAKLWTKAEIATLKKEYPKTDTKQLAKKLKRTLEAVRFQAKKRRLKKTKSYMESLYSAARKTTTKKGTAKRTAKKKVSRKRR